MSTVILDVYLNNVNVNDVNINNVNVNYVILNHVILKTTTSLNMTLRIGTKHQLIASGTIMNYNDTLAKEATASSNRVAQ